jgi:hypothetical protein
MVYMARRIPANDFVVETRLDLGEEYGLVVFVSLSPTSELSVESLYQPQLYEQSNSYAPRRRTTRRGKRGSNSCNPTQRSSPLFRTSNKMRVICTWNIVLALCDEAAKVSVLVARGVREKINK